MRFRFPLGIIRVHCVTTMMSTPYYNTSGQETTLMVVQGFVMNWSLSHHMVFEPQVLPHRPLFERFSLSYAQLVIFSLHDYSSYEFPFGNRAITGAICDHDCEVPALDDSTLFYSSVCLSRVLLLGTRILPSHSSL